MHDAVSKTDYQVLCLSSSHEDVLLLRDTVLKSDWLILADAVI